MAEKRCYQLGWKAVAQMIDEYRIIHEGIPEMIKDPWKRAEYQMKVVKDEGLDDEVLRIIEEENRKRRVLQ